MIITATSNTRRSLSWTVCLVSSFTATGFLVNINATLYHGLFAWRLSKFLHFSCIGKCCTSNILRSWTVLDQRFELLWYVHFEKLHYCSYLPSLIFFGRNLKNLGIVFTSWKCALNGLMFVPRKCGWQLSDELQACYYAI